MRTLIAWTLVLVGWTGNAEAQNVFRVTGGGSYSTGDTIEAHCIFDTVDPTQGWSFSLCHQLEVLLLLDAVPGATTLTVQSGEEPDFLAILTSPIPGPGVTMGVVIDFFSMVVLAPGTGHEILEVSYEVLAENPMVPAPDLVSEVCFCDTLGTPPVITVLTVGGMSATPQQLCAEILVPALGPPPDFCLDLDCTASAAEVVLDIVVDCAPFAYFAVHRDGVFLAMLDGAETTYVDPEVSAGETWHYTVTATAFPDPVGPAELLQASCDITVPTIVIGALVGDRGYFFGGDPVTISGTGFESGIAPPAVLFGENEATEVIVLSDTELTCVTPPARALGLVDVTVAGEAGSATVADAFTYGFVRGDVDGNKSVLLDDAVDLLGYLFLDEDPPSCFDAADATDDGSLNLADPVYLLAALFQDGPLPPPPFPTAGTPLTDIPPSAVGVDPTTDGLGCIPSG